MVPNILPVQNPWDAKYFNVPCRINAPYVCSVNEYAAGTFVLVMNIYTIYAYKKCKLGVKL
jgi:hypothetical protein